MATLAIRKNPCYIKICLGVGGRDEGKKKGKTCLTQAKDPSEKKTSMKILTRTGLHQQSPSQGQSQQNTVSDNE